MSNSQLHLQVNHKASQRERYSYLHTPAEYQAPTFPARNANIPEHGVEDQTQVSPIGSPPPFSQLENCTSSPTLSKASATPYIQPQPNPTPPPLSEHPAHFAPYADPPVPLLRQQQSYYAEPPRLYTPPPASPGPLPLKQCHSPIVRPPFQDQYNISPDSNPLAPPDPISTPKPSSISGGGSQLGTRTTGPDLYHAPGQVVHPRQEVKGGTWSYGLCDCRDPGVCCMGIWCPCILYGRTQYRVSRKSDSKDPTNMLGYETCNASCTAMALLCGCQWLLATIQHIRVRRAYGISSNVATDCVRASCCTCCTLIQDEREIKYREEAARLAGGTPGTEPSAYTAPGQMVFSPPPR